MSRELNYQEFKKGVNQRFNDYEGDPTRFKKLQNARISERGNTFDVSRIKGYITRSGTALDMSEKVYDMIIGPNDDLFVLYRHSTQNVAKLVVFNTATNPFTVVNTFTIHDMTNDFADLTRKTNTVYISGSTLMVNRIENEYYLNDVVPEIPKVINVTETS
ncbi:hypothetical protein ACKGJO_06565 [Gracilimonas sp. Q87]|uniref:hypothetical protein n=1 Tax=Gracilimonas sp. Q87 TaxID=3384766 RepID=UPI0039841217